MSEFFDHFDSGSLGGNWTPLTAGQGQVTVSDHGALLDVSSTTAGNDAAAIAYAFDRTAGLYHRVSACYSSTASGLVGFRPAMRLVYTPSGPAVLADRAALNAVTLLQIYQNQVASTRFGSLGYFDTGGTNTTWQESSQSFVTTSAQSSTLAITNPDYHEVGFEWDEANARARMFWKHRASGSTWPSTNTTGYKLIALTDWIDLSSIRDAVSAGAGELSVILGWPETQSSHTAGDGQHVEWFCHEWSDALVDAWTNERPNGTGNYQLKHWTGVAFEGRCWLPESRTGLALAAGSWHTSKVQWGGVVYDDATGTYWMVFNGQNAGTTLNHIGVISSPTGLDGSWSTSSAPVITATGAGTEVFGAYQCTLTKDMTEPDPDKRWKICASIINQLTDGYRDVVLYTSPNPDGPYTRQGYLWEGDATYPTAALHNPPLLLGGVWYLFISDFVCTGASLDVGAFTPDYSTPLIDPDVDQAGTTVTTGSSTSLTVSVASTTGFAKDMLVVYDKDATANAFALTRVRKVVDATTLQLYHLVPGMTSAGTLRSVGYGVGKNNFTQEGWDAANNVWRQWGTQFDANTGRSGTNVDNYEGGGCWTSPTLIGATYTTDWERTPGIPGHIWGATGSSENVRFVTYPVTAAAAGAALQGTMRGALARLTGALTTTVALTGRSVAATARAAGSLTTTVALAGAARATPARVVGALTSTVAMVGTARASRARLTGGLATRVALTGTAVATPARLTGQFLVPVALAGRGIGTWAVLRGALTASVRVDMALTWAAHADARYAWANATDARTGLTDLTTARLALERT